MTKRFRIALEGDEMSTVTSITIPFDVEYPLHPGGSNRE